MLTFLLIEPLDLVDKVFSIYELSPHKKLVLNDTNGMNVPCLKDQYCHLEPLSMFQSHINFFLI